MSMKASPELKEEIRSVQNYPKESLEEIVRRIVTLYKIDLILTDEEIKSVNKGLADIKAGRVYTTKQLEKELGI